MLSQTQTEHVEECSSGPTPLDEGETSHAAITNQGKGNDQVGNRSLGLTLGVDAIRPEKGKKGPSSSQEGLFGKACYFFGLKCANYLKTLY